MSIISNLFCAHRALLRVTALLFLVSYHNAHPSLSADIFAVYVVEENDQQIAKYFDDQRFEGSVDVPILSRFASVPGASAHAMLNAYTGTIESSWTVDTNGPDGPWAWSETDVWMEDVLYFTNGNISDEQNVEIPWTIEWIANRENVYSWEVKISGPDVPTPNNVLFHEKHIGEKNSIVSGHFPLKGSLSTFNIQIHISPGGGGGTDPQCEDGSCSISAHQEFQFKLGELPDGVTFGSGSGYFLRGDMYAPKNLVILAHGFQPATSHTNAYRSRLPEIRSALTDRLEREDLLKDTLIMEFVWPEAFIDVVWPEASDPLDFLAFLLALPHYAETRYSTYFAGVRLARHIEKFVKDIEDATDKRYDPVIHMIGHSLGTMVNARAASFLTNPQRLTILDHPLTIEQITILDSPLDPNGVIRLNDDGSQSFDVRVLTQHEEFFWRTLNSTRIKYVENFYGESKWPWSLTLTPAFGKAIAGSGPCLDILGVDDALTCGGKKVQNANHLSIIDYYAELILGNDPNGDDWNSPLLSKWRVEKQWDVKKAREEADRGIHYEAMLNEPNTNVLPFGLVMQTDKGGYLLETASPAGITFAYTLPKDAIEVSAEIKPIQGTGIIRVYFNDKLLWSYQFESSDQEPVQILVPLPLYADMTGNFKWELSPSTENIAVAELSSLFLITTGNLKNANSQDDLDGNGLPDTWEQLYFHQIETNWTEDSDNDGIANAIEASFGMDPTNEDRYRLPKIKIQEGPEHDTLLCYQRPVASPGSSVEYIYSGLQSVMESSADMITWTSVLLPPNAQASIVVSDDGETETVMVPFKDLTRNGEQFFRFRVTSNVSN